ncbi:MAG TPA: hypothetical protein PL033_06035 [Candidatus Brocadiia bacterium]|nr:hypothetical protein [Candidatus Brocadiia bacterium]
MNGPRYRVETVRDPACFLRALPILVPTDAVLYLEDGCHPPEIREFLTSRQSANPIKVEMGTIWPRPLCFHLPATPENIGRLAELAQNRSGPEIAIHVIVYRNHEVILEWYDAFDAPMYIAKSLGKEKIEAFCKELNANWADDDPV